MNNKIKLEEKIVLLAELDGIKCELDHSGDPKGQRQAVNYLMLELKSGETIALPICGYCDYELQKGYKNEPFEWYLLICQNCQSTKWLYKDNCKNDYPEQIHFVHTCPDCDFMYQNISSDIIQ
jgi:hypothetical protein